jgi:hypothetical protein
MVSDNKMLENDDIYEKIKNLRNDSKSFANMSENSRP